MYFMYLHNYYVFYIHNNINLLGVLSASYVYHGDFWGFDLTYMIMDDKISKNPLVKILILCEI